MTRMDGWTSLDEQRVPTENTKIRHKNLVAHKQWFISDSESHRCGFPHVRILTFQFGEAQATECTTGREKNKISRRRHRGKAKRMAVVFGYHRISARGPQTRNAMTFLRAVAEETGTSRNEKRKSSVLIKHQTISCVFAITLLWQSFPSLFVFPWQWWYCFSASQREWGIGNSVAESKGFV